MKLAFWVSAAIILYTYAGYPLIISLLAKMKPRPWRRENWPVGGDAPISIIMAVHNGTAMLPAKLGHLLTLDAKLVKEILVVSDGSNDGTAELLGRVTDARVRALVLEQHGGKAVALNHGITKATGEILLFVDIRPRIEEGALEAMLANFADPAVGCVAGELLLRTDGHDATASAVSGLYWKYEQWIRNCEAAVDSPVGVYGGFYAIRRALATAAPPGLILDDMFQPLSIIRQGYRSVLDRSALVTDVWPGKASGEFQRKVRTLAGNFQLVAEAPWTIGPQNRVLLQLVSHKLLRLVVPYCFVVALVAAAVLGRQSAAFALVAGLQGLFWASAALALKWKLPLVGRIAVPASALLVLNAAAILGLYTFLFTRGPLWKIWSPTAAPGDTSLFPATTRKSV